MDDALVDGVEVEQVQGVGAALVAGNGQLVQACRVFLAGQLHGVGDVGLFCPAVGGQPRIRLLILHAVFKGLMEQAEVIPQTHTVPGQIQSCQRIKETGGQTAQTAVAQRGFRLQFFNVGQALAGGGQCITGFIVQPQIDEVIGKQLADEELGADIVQLAAGDRLNPVCALLPDDFQQSKVQVLIRAVGQRLASEIL